METVPPMMVVRCGLIGAGKTMLTQRDALDGARRRGAVFASNIWTDNSYPWAAWVRIRDDYPDANWRVQLSTGRDGFDMDELDDVISWTRARNRGTVLLLDEVGILIPARMWQRFGVDLMQQFSQSRKNRVDVWLTAQDIEDVDAYVRRKVAKVWKVRSFPPHTIARQEKGRRPWLFFETEWLPGQVGRKDKRLGWRLRRYRRSDEIEYDTDEIVRPARRLTDADLCSEHKRERSKAECPVCNGSAAGVAGSWRLVDEAPPGTDPPPVGPDAPGFREAVMAGSWAAAP